MALKSLSKKLAILTLSLATVLPVNAMPCGEHQSVVRYDVFNLARPGGGHVEATVEEKLLSHSNIKFKGGSYAEKDWVSFLLTHLLFGPESTSVTNVEFTTTAPEKSCIVATISDISVYLSEDRGRLSIVCGSISETAKMNLLDWHTLITYRLHSDLKAVHISG